MPKLRFVHAADLHLDSPFTGLRAIAPDEVRSALRSATFDVYDRIVELCIEERVDALLVAGDVYDGADRSLRAQLKFVDGLRRLDAAGIRIVHLPRQPRPAGRLGGEAGPARRLCALRAGGHGRRRCSRMTPFRAGHGVRDTG